MASLLILLTASLAAAQVGPGRGKKKEKPRFYKGRQIAQTMHYFGASWLVRESRQREEDCKTLLRVLDVQPGDVVCDLGCGNGFYTLPIAEQVGETGKVYAVDIQKQMLSLLRQRAKGTGLMDRIEPVLCTVDDPKLPPKSVDLVLLVDVYHELSHPEEVLQKLHESLKPGGRIALVEFRTEDPKVPIKPLHKMSKWQIFREIPPNRFRLVDQFDGLPWQHLMFFARQGDDESGLTDSVRTGLRKATSFLRTIAVNGGYAGIYSLDLKERYGESLRDRAGKNEIWVQPPGTPSVVEVMLRAFRLTGEDLYFDTALEAGRALAWAQSDSGGWGYRVDVSALKPKARKVQRKKGRGTFDDNVSQGALTALIDLDDVAVAKWLTETIDLGIRHLLDAQAENGGWPQWYPLRGGYSDHFTFNDNAINDCIRTAWLAHERYGRKDCRAAALSGGDFIIRSQLSAPQAGWAQQHDRETLRPVAARRFEPAGVCSAVTARNLHTLMKLHLWTGDDRFLTPVPKALDWLKRSQLASDRWARFYELETNRPIYGDRDGKIYYSLAEISEERRLGYAWERTFGVPGVRADWAVLRESGSAALAARWEGSGSAGDRKNLRAVVERSLKELDDAGRWTRDGRIHIGDFVRNVRVLCDWLDLPRH